MINTSPPGAASAPLAIVPSGLYVTSDDALLLTSYNAAASVTLRIGGRVLTPDRRVVPFEASQVANTDRTAKTTTVQVGEGWLQSLSVVVSGGSPIPGQTFVTVDLVRGSSGARTVHATLVGGPVTTTLRQAWPGNVLHGPLDHRGALRSVTGTDPAANTEIAETVPTGARWRLRSLRVTLVTDANAANREVSLLVDDGTATLYAVPSGVNQAASLTRNYSFAAQAVRGAAATSGDIIVPIPDLDLRAGYRIQTSTANRQATDNFGAPQLLVEESIEGA
jgi:hypothetical protein